MWVCIWDCAVKWVHIRRVCGWDDQHMLKWPDQLLPYIQGDQMAPEDKDTTAAAQQIDNKPTACLKSMLALWVETLM